MIFETFLGINSSIKFIVLFDFNAVPRLKLLSLLLWPVGNAFYAAMEEQLHGQTVCFTILWTPIYARERVLEVKLNFHHPVTTDAAAATNYNGSPVASNVAGIDLSFT